MSTLIAVHNSEGCAGRCDAKCYDATGPECDCICGGKNHGAGLLKDGENTRAMAKEWIAKWDKNHPGQKLSYELTLGL